MIGPAAAGDPPEDARPVPQPIIEDFAAIHARMVALRARDQPVPRAAPHAAPHAASPAAPQDFHGWLTSGNLWRPGA